MAVFYVHYTHYSMCASSVMSGVEWMVVGTRTIQKNTSRFDEILGSIKSISLETPLFCLTWVSDSLAISYSICATSVMFGVEWMVVVTLVDLMKFWIPFIKIHFAIEDLKFIFCLFVGLRRFGNMSDVNPTK